MKPLIIIIVFCIVVALIWQYIQNRYFHRYEIVVMYDKRRLYRGTLKQCNYRIREFNVLPTMIRCIHQKKGFVYVITPFNKMIEAVELKGKQTIKNETK